MKSPIMILMMSGIFGLNESLSQALPDLMIENIISKSTVFQPGHNYPDNFSYWLKNAGSANGTYSFTAYYLSTDTIKDDNDILLQYEYSKIVQAGDSTMYHTEDFSVPFSTVFGSYYILFVADFYNHAEELSETNNVSAFPVTIGNINADLTLKLFEAPPPELVPGEIKKVKIELRNKGATAVDANFACFLSEDSTWNQDDKEINFCLSEVYEYCNYRYNLGQNDSEIFITDLIVPPDISYGSYHLLFLTDYSNAVNETDESNNILGYPVSIVQQNADLKIINAFVTPSAIVGGKNCTISFDVFNTGSTGTDRNVPVKYCISKDTIFDPSDFNFYYDGISGSTYTGYEGSTTDVGVNDLNPHHISINKTTRYDTPPGNYYILIVADPGHSISESNNVNNTGYYPIKIVGPDSEALAMDVKIISGNLTADVLAPGRYAKAISQIYNPDSSGISAQIYYFLSADTVLDDQDITVNYSSGIYSSSADTILKISQVKLPQDISAGQYFFFFDLRYIPNDPNLQNNHKFLPVTILPGDYDFSLNFIEDPPAAASPGDQVRYSMEFYNNSKGKPGGFKICFFLSEDTIFSEDDLSMEMVNFYDSWVYYSYSDTMKSGPMVIIPAGINYGNKYIFVQIDSDNAFPETDENNNLVFFPVNIVSPDVDLSFFSQNPTIGTIDNYNYLRWKENIINAGSTPSSPALIYYFLSSDSVFDGTDDYLATRTLPAINGKGNYNYPWASYHFGYNSVLPSGDFYLIAYLDKYNQIPESNENNNISYIKFEHPSTGIELALNTPVLSGTEGINGKRVHVSFSLKNEGINKTAKVITKYYLSVDSIYGSDDVKIGERENYNIDPSGFRVQYSSIYFPYGTQPGNYYIIVVVDPENKIQEMDENNNSRAVPYSILVKTMDYSINSPMVFPDTVIAGQSANCFFNIEKTGNNSYQYYPGVSILFSSDSIYGNNDIEAGSVSNYTNSYFIPKNIAFYIPENIADGNYSVLFYIDKENNYQETDENNNMAWFPVTVKHEPKNIDFVIGFASVQKPIKPGDVIAFTCAVENQGSTSVFSYPETGYYLSTDSIWGEEDVILNPHFFEYEIYPGLDIPEDIAQGNYYIIFFADYQKEIDEQNEFNNTKAIPVSIMPSDIDLWIQSASVSTDTIPIRGEAVVNFVIKNSGNEDSPLFKNRIYISKDSVLSEEDKAIGGSNNFFGINAHDSLELSSPINLLYYSLDTGSYFLICVTDDLYWGSPQFGEIWETNENNNTFILPVTLRQTDIDISFTELQAPVNAIIPGISFPFKFKIINSGADKQSGVNVNCYLSKDSIFSPLDIKLNYWNGLSIEADSSIQWNTSLVIDKDDIIASGIYYIFLVADQENYLVETDEENNMAYYPVNIFFPGEDTSLTNVGDNIFETNQTNFTLYPNPSNGKLTLRFGDNKLSKGEIYITNEFGILMKKEIVKNYSGEVILDLGNMAKGIYLLKYISREGFFVRKVLLQ